MLRGRTTSDSAGAAVGLGRGEPHDPVHGNFVKFNDVAYRCSVTPLCFLQSIKGYLI